MKKNPILLLSLFLMLILNSCMESKEIGVKSAWARPGIAGNTTAAYFLISNPLDRADKLLSAKSDIAQITEIHHSSEMNGTMSMQEQEYVEIPAKSKIEFKPIGLHVMFINLKQDLTKGDQFQLMLNFENSGQIVVNVEVQEP